MSKVAAAIRHVAFEDLGLLEPLLKQRGFSVVYHDAWEPDLEHLDFADLLILLGGPISVNDTERYPFMAREIEIARRRMDAGRPLLGICLGAQVMARAVGGSVVSGRRKEIEWSPLELTPEGEDSPLAALTNVPVLHWHGEVCVLPASIPSLAATPDCAAQAFMPGPQFMALQFHAEAGTHGVEAWLLGHTVEIDATPDVDVIRLREETARHGPVMARAGGRFFADWLGSIGL